MQKEEIIEYLKSNEYEEVLTLIEEAENGEFEILELAPSLGLIRDAKINEAVIGLLESIGVIIEYVEEEDE